MAIRRLNHAVLYVRDVERSSAFYRDVLGFREAFGAPGARFLQAPDSDNDHDLGLFAVGEGAAPSPAGRGAVGLYHLAWEVGSLGELRECRERLARAGALAGASDHGTTKSLYGKDPDGLEFEITWVVPPSRLGPADLAARGSVRRLDLEAELARFEGGSHGPARQGLPEHGPTPASGENGRRDGRAAQGSQREPFKAGADPSLMMRRIVPELAIFHSLVFRGVFFREKAVKAVS